MTLADLITTSSRGYDISVGTAQTVALDFRDSYPVVTALASDCSKFSSAAFQSLASIANDFDGRDSFAWGLIKLYYAAFYAGHALTRTLGEGCSFLYKRHTDKLSMIADAYGISPPLRIGGGLYHCVLNPESTVVSYSKATSASGGSHEAFWKVFGLKISSVSDSVLAGSLPTADAQAVFAKLHELLAILNRKGDASWLSGVRNDLQYRLQHGVWFPEIARPQSRRDLGRVANQWRRDPMSIDLTERRWGLLGDFSVACAFIVSLCRDMFGEIAGRSPKGIRSFAKTGPLAYLSDIGVAA